MTECTSAFHPPWAARLRAARKRKMLSQAELAERIEKWRNGEAAPCDAQKVGRWERGVQQPYPVSQRALCEVLEVTRRRWAGPATQRPRTTPRPTPARPKENHP
jgi:transcriptional regulator with XRE-family HTH domain